MRRRCSPNWAIRRFFGEATCVVWDAAQKIERAQGSAAHVALRLTEKIQRELPVQMSLGQARILLKGWSAAEVERAFTRALEICEHLGNPPEVFFALFGLWTNYHVRGTYRAARDSARQLVRLAQSTGDHTHLVLAHYAMGETSLHTGELQVAREHQEIVLSLYDKARDRPLAFRLGSDVKQGIRSYAGWTLWLLGYPDRPSPQARRRSHSLATYPIPIAWLLPSFS
jgi:predicted ATPase